MHTLLLKPALDDRNDKKKFISSRIGLEAKADLFTDQDDLEAHILESHAHRSIDCVLLDEAQFLTHDQVWQLSRVTDDHGIPIMCYGLRTDFMGQLFTGSAALLALADDIREIRTLCWCGKKATMNMRVDGAGQAVTQGAQIEVGGNERYITLCRKHWRDKHINAAAAAK